MPDEPYSRTRWLMGFAAWRAEHTGQVRSAISLLSWLYVLGAVYLILGALWYPEWWKRFVFYGGLFDRKLLKFSFHYLWQLLVNFHPLGVTLAVLVSLAVVMAIYLTGKHGVIGAIANIRSPSRSVIVVVSIVFGVVLVALMQVEGDYRTPAEWDEYVTTLRLKLNDPIPWAIGKCGPASGFYLYLDGERVSRAYSALQSDMVVSSQTEKRALESATGGALKVPPAEASSSLKLATEETTVKIPPSISAERQADWLIEH